MSTYRLNLEVLEQPDPLPSAQRALVDVHVVEQLAALLAPIHAEALIPAVLGVFHPYLQAAPEPTPAPAPAHGKTGLSGRELEVVQLAAAGLTNNEIGKRLYLTEDTVKTHMRRVHAKLEVRNRAQAVARAYELDLIGRDRHEDQQDAGPGR